MPKRIAPPTFRGSDFAMRYEQGQWSENRIIEAIRNSGTYCAFPYGRSSVGPKDKAKIAEYWAEYIKAESIGKRPDILVIRREDYDRLGDPEQRLGDTTLATDETLSDYLEVAVCGVEAENSLWRAAKMPDFGKTTLTKLNFIAPTVIVKQEDESELVAWQSTFGIPICVVQAFFDRAYIVRLDFIVEAVSKIKAAAAGEGVVGLGFEPLDVKDRKRAADRVQKDLGVFISEQSFSDARSGTATKKTLYRTHYSVACEFGIVSPENQPTVIADYIEEDNGKIMPYVRFVGGRLDILPSALELFDQLAQRLERNT
jgi:AccI restriction endonuclease